MSKPRLFVNACLFLFSLCTCLGPARVLAASAVLVDSPAQLLSGEHAGGQIGDYLLENEYIAVIVSAPEHGGYYAETGGNIIDAGSSLERSDALAEFYTYFDDDWPRQALYSSLSILDDGSGGGPARLLALGVDSGNSAVSVTSKYILATGDRHVTIITTLHNSSGVNHSAYELGDAFSWGACSRFAPVYGYELDGTTSEVWLAGSSGHVSYGYLSPLGLIWGPHGNGWSDVNVVTAALPAGGEVSYTRYFIVGDGDIASVAAVIHVLSGTACGTLACNVSEDGNGLPLPEAWIDAFDAGGDIYLRMHCDDDGLADATLPSGGWSLLAQELAYDSAEQTVDLATDEYIELDFSLAYTGGTYPLGDTLTVIQRPLLNIPALIATGDTLEIDCAADPETSGWSAWLKRDLVDVPMTVVDAAYNYSTELWRLRAIPSGEAQVLYELYDLHVTADGIISDSSVNAVRLMPVFREDFYFIHITDTHLPTHLFNYQSGAAEDSSEVGDLRAVIEDINILNPEFVLLTGDLVNEGELEDYLGWRVYSRAQRLLAELDVPLFLTAGNHDLGGWVDTPPVAGTARRDWWRFFGWRHLDDPPPGAPWRTQNYSFDYGSVHFSGLEAYDNYDMWRSEYYGSESFTAGQLQWLSADLNAASDAEAHVLFYHYDFGNQLNLNSLGVDMALWGHIHHDAGNLNTQPWDLATDNTCDGARAYRLIRYENGQLNPRQTISAGSSGTKLCVTYQTSQEGSRTTVTAQVVNQHAEAFANGLLRFELPKGAGAYELSLGELTQIDDSDSLAVCYVELEIPADSSFDVEMSYDATSAPGDSEAPTALRLLGNHPNPFNPTTRISFTLPDAGRTLLTVHDLRGRRVALLLDEKLPAGRQALDWNGRGMTGRELASGVYLLRLEADGRTRTRKIALLR